MNLLPNMKYMIDSLKESCNELSSALDQAQKAANEFEDEFLPQTERLDLHGIEVIDTLLAKQAYLMKVELASISKEIEFFRGLFRDGQLVCKLGRSIAEISKNLVLAEDD